MKTIENKNKRNRRVGFCIAIVRLLVLPLLFSFFLLRGCAHNYDNFKYPDTIRDLTDCGKQEK